MQTTLTKIDDGTPMPMLNAYKYDQLNRLLEARSYESGLSNNVWNPASYNNEYFNKFEYDANGNILSQKRHLRNGTQTDDLTYRYLLDNGKLLRNRLYHVNDSIAGATYVGDLEDQGLYIDTSHFAIENHNNYLYDAEGRLIQDLAEGIQEIVWRVDGKVKAVNFTSSSGKNNLEFDYDAFGRRIAKHVHDQQGLLVKSTYYVLDAQGNQLSTYEHVVDNEENNYQLAERVMYGSSRLGINTNKVDMLDEDPEEIISLSLGNKLYEMSNHLGNVLTVINDIKIPQSSNSVDVDGYLATIVSTADYSPFGVQLDGRTESAETYRFGFQGQEKDDEIKGAGNSYDFGMRLYDARIARFISIDPLKERNSHESNYTYASNNPIVFIDLEGGDNVVYLFVPADGALKTTDKNNATCQTSTANKIAAEANKMFETMNVGTRVVVFEGTYAEFQAMQISNTDRRALVGSIADGDEFLKDNNSSLTLSVPVLDQSPGVIAVHNEYTKELHLDGLGVKTNAEVSAFGIVHGTSHTTGASHCGKHTDPTEDDKCNPDVLRSHNRDANGSHHVNYAQDGWSVTSYIGAYKTNVYDLMTPSRAPLTILAHINTFEPKRYQAIQNTAYQTAQKLVDARLAQFGNIVKLSPEGLQRAYQQCANELMQNAEFVTNAINSTKPVPAKPKNN